MYIADLHIHSRYSRATSKECVPEYLDLWARRKGIHILGTGDFTHMAKSYVRRVFRDVGSIDRRVLFITYAGMDKKRLQYIQDLVKQYCTFERVYLQKASSAIASNCGPGSFGLLFMRKNEAVISYSEASRQNILE